MHTCRVDAAGAGVAQHHHGRAAFVLGGLHQLRACKIAINTWVGGWDKWVGVCGGACTNWMHGLGVGDVFYTFCYNNARIHTFYNIPHTPSCAAPSRRRWTQQAKTRRPGTSRARPPAPAPCCVNRWMHGWTDGCGKGWWDLWAGVKSNQTLKYIFTPQPTPTPQNPTTAHLSIGVPPRRSPPPLPPRPMAVAAI